MLLFCCCLLFLLLCYCVVVPMLYYCIVMLCCLVVVLLFCIPLFTVYLLFSGNIRQTIRPYTIEDAGQLVSVLNIQYQLFNV